jgi:hypothetical protein
MGDASASAQLHGMAARAGVDHLGFCCLYRGEAAIGCGRVVDRGYVDRGRGVQASTARNGNPTVEAWCAQVSQCALRTALSELLHTTTELHHTMSNYF